MATTVAGATHPVLRAPSPLRGRRWRSTHSAGDAAPAFVVLVQLDHVAAGIGQEDLLGIRVRGALERPVRDAHAIELGLGLDDVLNAERDMRSRRILPGAGTLREPRRARAADQVDLADLADVDSHAGNAGNFRPASVVRQAEHAAVEITYRLELGIVDAHRVMMDFQNLDRHGCSSNRQAAVGVQRATVPVPDAILVT